MNPKYPIYIPSKGRWETRHTSRTLERMGVPYSVIVEEQEYEKYANVIDRGKLLVLDKEFQRTFDPFDDLGDTVSKGSGPARNFAWEHSNSVGAKRHWVIDDNITRFGRTNRNHLTPVECGEFFRCMEDFVDRYENVAMAGPQYFMFITRKARWPAFITNTRIYSCNLILNGAPFRWRGRFNEDTDLSLRMLKGGYCTVLFYAFWQHKLVTQTIKGGNTEVYKSVGTLAKSQMIVDMHPDVARLTERFGRDHHYVDYTPFKANKLKFRPGVEIPRGVNEYGMVRQIRIDGKWVNESEIEKEIE